MVGTAGSKRLEPPEEGACVGTGRFPVKVAELKEDEPELFAQLLGRAEKFSKFLLRPLEDPVVGDRVKC